MTFRRLLTLLLPLLLCGAAIAQTPVPPASLLEPESALQETPKRREEFLTPLASQVTEPASNMATGVSIDRYIGEADKSPSRRWRNVMFVQNILRSGDPDPAKPGNPGAVLKNNRTMDLVTLPARNITPLTAATDQFVLYVESGAGRLDDGTSYWDLRPGIAVLVPPNAMHRFTNTGDAPLKMLVLTQITGPDFTPRKDMLVRDTNLMAMSEENVHWSNMSKFVFQAADGMAGGGRILLVYMGPMTIAGPHSHVPNTEEMWVKVTNGPALMQMGSEIRPWRQNMGILAPPNGRTVHAAINTSNQIQHWFYFGAFPPNPNAGRGGANAAGRGAQPSAPPSFAQAAAQRSNVAGRPLSSLPPDAYRW
jgi:mannose-6-phosphate isomerase-like protein (cupin superfamily)